MEEKINVIWLGVNPDFLRKIGEAHGFLDASSNSLPPELVLCVDWSTRDKKKLRNYRASGLPSFLIMQEPSVVIPKHLVGKIKREFDYVVTVGRLGGDANINWPQAWDSISNLSSPRKNRGVVINADKWSAVYGELYSLRRKIVNLDERIDLFGSGWSDSPMIRIKRAISAIGFAVLNGRVPKIQIVFDVFKRPLHHLGKSIDKIETLKNYRYSIVIENSQEYMSEKLFDCLFAGTIPVYVGANLDNLGIPENLVVVAEPTFEAIQLGIEKALSMDLKKFHKELRTWLDDPAVIDHWAESHVLPELFARLRSAHQNN